MKKVIILAAFAAMAAASQAQVTVYNSLTSGATGGTTSTDLTRIVGDDLNLSSGGILTRLQWTVNNSASGVGPILTMNTTIKIYDNTTPYTGGVLANPLLASITFGINFGTGLNPGFYSTVTSGNLGAFNITLPSKILITQQNTQLTGSSTRYGVMLFNVPSPGTSNTSTYMKGVSTAEGLYNFSTNNTTNLGLSVQVAPEPGTMAALGLGAVALIRRRRSSK